MEPGIWHGALAAREQVLRSMTWNDGVRSVSNLKLPNTPEPGAASSIWFASNERKFSVLETQREGGVTSCSWEAALFVLSHFEVKMRSLCKIEMRNRSVAWHGWKLFMNAFCPRFWNVECVRSEVRHCSPAPPVGGYCGHCPRGIWVICYKHGPGNTSSLPVQSPISQLKPERST